MPLGVLFCSPPPSSTVWIDILGDDVGVEKAFKKVSSRRVEVNKKSRMRRGFAGCWRHIKRITKSSVVIQFAFKNIYIDKTSRLCQLTWQREGFHGQLPLSLRRHDPQSLPSQPATQAQVEMYTKAQDFQQWQLQTQDQDLRYCRCISPLACSNLQR